MEKQNDCEAVSMSCGVALEYFYSVRKFEINLYSKYETWNKQHKALGIR